MFKSLEAFSKNKDLSTPTQIGLKKMDIHRGENINVLSLHDGIKVTGKVVKKLKRPVMKGMRSVSSRSLMKSETGREKRIEQQSSRSFLEVPSRLVKRRLQSNEGPMEVEVEENTVELEEHPGIELSRTKAGDQVITGGTVVQNWGKEEDRTNREDKILWKAIKQVILAEPNEVRFSKEYYREEDYDRLLNEAAKELQIVTTGKPRVHFNTRAYIAKEMRSLGFLFGFYI